jgi:hypothetical protein
MRRRKKRKKLNMATTSSTTNEIVALKKPGPWIYLPQVIVDIILQYAGDPDLCGYLLMTSKTVFQPSEKVYQFICEYIYRRQTARAKCDIHRWKSWRDMLINRPRLRTNGYYAMKTTYTKTYNNDAFWEEKKFESIEVKYYRHFRFFDNGRVLYSLDITDPYEMGKLLKMGSPVAKKVYSGHYLLKRNHLLVEVTLPYCQMIFELLIMDFMEFNEKESHNEYNGKFNVLHLLRHVSRQLPNNPEEDAGGLLAVDDAEEGHLVHYPLPSYNYFYFYRRNDYFG